jgi:hypothetical protein
MIEFGQQRAVELLALRRACTTKRRARTGVIRGIVTDLIVGNDFVDE